VRRKNKAGSTTSQHPIAYVRLRSLLEGEVTIHEQYVAAERFVGKLNEALIDEQCTLSTVLESRFAARDGKLVLEIFCVRAEQLSIFMDSAYSGREADPDELMSDARGRWANALRQALVGEETIRLELPGLATAATRLKADEDGALFPLVRPTELEPVLNRQVPEDATHAIQGGSEFDLTDGVNNSPPVWEAACTVRAQPRLARNGIALKLLEAPLGHLGKKARVSIEDMSTSDLLVITGAAKRKVGVWLEVQLATSPGHSRSSIGKVLGLGSREAYSRSFNDIET
jgi:hypothetical protein